MLKNFLIYFVVLFIPVGLALGLIGNLIYPPSGGNAGLGGGFGAVFETPIVDTMISLILAYVHSRKP